jgi:hypothetical protein
LLALWTPPVSAENAQERQEKERLMLEANALELTLVQNPGAERPAGALVIRLAFPATADMDLFVTDPSQETVYFANNPGKTGGQLEADQRCDSAPPRIEQFILSQPVAGVYRVGVDFPERCDENKDAVSYVVHVESDSGRLSRRKTLVPGIFDTVSLEFSFDAQGAH